MNIKKFLKRKYIIWAVIVVLAAAAIWFLFFRPAANTQAPFVAHAGEFVNQISVSGKIKASQDVDLSFAQPGIVRGVYVSVGQKVATGKLLASQDTGDLYAQVSQMQAGIDLQKAKLAQLLAGALPQDVKIKEDAVASAKNDLQNSYDSALTAMTSAYNMIYTTSTLALYMQNTYFTTADQEGILFSNAKNAITASLTDAKNSLDSAASSHDAVDGAMTRVQADLNTTYSSLKTIREQTDLGVYYSRVSAADKTSLDTQRANVNTALTSLTSAKQSLASYKAALLQAQNQLDAINAAPRVTDTAVYDAQIAQAQASLQQVYAQIRQKQIIAPIFGTITLVDAKVGSIFGSSAPAISIISNGKFQIESYVPEIYISSVKTGNLAEITLDAYGPDKKFGATVVSIDPSETIKDGVSTYKTILEFTEGDDGIKDGMSANVVIITNKKEHVISVPQGLVVVRNGKKFVKVQQGKDVVEKEVQTGDISSSGQVEIISGLNEGDILPIQ